MSGDGGACGGSDGSGGRKRTLAGVSEGVAKKASVDASGEQACRAWANLLKQSKAWPETAQLPSKHGVIAVVGAYNAGKSALVNALIGEQILLTAPVEQTHEPWAVVPPQLELDQALLDAVPTLVRVESPGAPPNLVLLDTPGYGGVDGEDVLDKVLPLCQAILLCISSQTPVTMQDVEVARRLSQNGRSVMIVLTKSDLARNAAELSSVLESVKTRLAPSLHEAPKVWTVAAMPTHIEDGHFEMGEFVTEMRSLGTRMWLQYALMVTARDLLQAATEAELEEMKQKSDTLAGESESLRKATADVDRLCDDIVVEINVCLERVRRQAHDLEGSNLHCETALSTPLTAFRRQMDHMVELAVRGFQSLLTGDTLASCQEELERFKHGCADILRECEQDMDALTDSMIEESEGEDEDCESRNYVPEAVSAATALAAGAMMGPAAAFAAAALGFVGSMGLRRQQITADSKHDAKVTRRLLGQPSFHLELVGDNVARLRSVLKKPLFDRVFKASESRRQMDQDAEALRRCRADFLPCINSTLRLLGVEVKKEMNALGSGQRRGLLGPGRPEAKCGQGTHSHGELQMLMHTPLCSESMVEGAVPDTEREDMSR